MNVKLGSIACARSGDKGKHSNIGVVFYNDSVYKWAVGYLTEDKIAEHFKGLVKGNVVRYKLDNLFSLNFILHDSLGGGGSESLLDDAQGKTYGQFLLMMNIEIPDNFKEFINE